MKARLPTLVAAALLAACSSSQPVVPRMAFGEPLLAATGLTQEARENFREFRVTDVDGDGRPDVLLGYYLGSTGTSYYSVFLNDGAGGLRAPIIVAGLFAVSIADMNGDGRPDLFGCGPGPRPRLLLGTAIAGNWAEAALPEAGICQATAIGDFDGDGRKDLAVLGAGNPGVTVPKLVILRGQGDGTFLPPGNPFSPELPGPSLGATGILAGQFDGDSRTDLAFLFTNGEVGTWVQISTSRGDGTFALLAPERLSFPPEFTRRSAYAISVADLNRDGRDDVIMNLLGYVYPISIPIPGAPGSPSPPPPGPVKGLWLSRSGEAHVARFLDQSVETTAYVGDIDGDGIPDLLYWTASAGGSLPSLLAAIGVGDGTFRDAVVVASPSTLMGGYTAVADMNGDGRADVVTYGAQVVVMLQK